MATSVLVVGPTLRQQAQKILVHEINDARWIDRVELAVIHLVRGCCLPPRVLHMVTGESLSVEG